MAVLVVALLDAAVLWWLWPQPDWRFLLGAWTLAVGDCAVAPYLAAVVTAWSWRRVLADPRVTAYEKQLAQFARDREGAGLLGRALLGIALCTIVALGGVAAMVTFPEARETVRLAVAGLGALAGLWAVWSALRTWR